MQLRLLLSNDDGARAEGMVWLKRALLPLGDCTCVAPDRPRSGSGHAITLHKPVRVAPVPCDLRVPTYECTGTPADCVTLGINDLCGGRPDLVVSGINDGANLGEDITYSGTVAAAMEGTIQGIPSLSVSVVTWDTADLAVEGFPGHRDGVHYDTAAKVVRELAKFALRHGLPSRTFLNVNVPNVAAEKITGIRLTGLGLRNYDTGADRRVDPSGRVYYWIHGSPLDDCYGEELDVGCVAAGKISVTPVTMDFTAHGIIEALQKQGVEEILHGLTRAS